MNIVQAWKKAKDGDTISIKGIYPYRFIKGEGCGKNLEMLFKHALGEENQLSDDWEVEHKPLVWEGEVEWYGGSSSPIHPEGGDCYRHISPFLGKRTKIRIEEILGNYILNSLGGK
jgi:hypothetical protein